MDISENDVIKKIKISDMSKYGHNEGKKYNTFFIFFISIILLLYMYNRTKGVVLMLGV
jgi:hypothetical protein